MHPILARYEDPETGLVAFNVDALERAKAQLENAGRREEVEAINDGITVEHGKQVVLALTVDQLAIIDSVVNEDWIDLTEDMQVEVREQLDHLETEEIVLGHIENHDPESYPNGADVPEKDPLTVEDTQDVAE